jgi:hypothetical protein
MSSATVLRPPEHVDNQVQPDEVEGSKRRFVTFMFADDYVISLISGTVLFREHS